LNEWEAFASYIPCFYLWLDSLDPNLKRLLMFVLIALAAVGSYRVACVE